MRDPGPAPFGKAIPPADPLLEAIFDAAPMALAYLDLDFNFLRVNPAYAKADQKEPRDLVGKNHFALYPHAENQRIFERVRDTGEPYRVVAKPFEYASNPERGVTHWDWSLTPTRDSGGRVTGLLLALQNVTERVEALRAALASERLLQSVIDTAPVRVFWKDKEGRYLGCNRVFARDAGVAGPEQVVGRTDHELAFAPHAELYRADDRRVIESGTPKLAYEEPQTSPGGAPLWLRTSKVPLFGQDGACLGVLGIYEDVTQEKTAQDALRTATAAAERASQAKSEFLANMSHEIRTPLNAVMGYVDLALEEPLNEAAAGYLSTARASARSLLAIINDILDFSRIEAGKLEFAQHPFSLTACLEQAQAIGTALARGKDVTLDLQHDPAIPPVLLGDAMRLTQVLTNLVGNAVKFTAEGTVRVVSRQLQREADTVLVGLEVHDTGTGIPADQLTRVFDAFVQADTSATRSFGGTGLGLAISRRMVEGMGGRITVQSTVGKGSSFVITLPLRWTEGVAPPTPVQLDWSQRFAGRRALVVEDNAVNRTLAQAMLRRLGFSVDCAENGLLALERVRAASPPYDIVFMDLQMPELDGLEATRRLRQVHGPAALPIVAMTANAFEQDRRNCLAAGMNEHLAKPLRLEELGPVINKVLEGRGAP